MIPRVKPIMQLIYKTMGIGYVDNKHEPRDRISVKWNIFELPLEAREVGERYGILPLTD